MIAAFLTILTYVVMLTCKQKPVIGKTNLDSAAVTCGVLQEGNLGPLLFVSYVHDMAISFDQECKNILIICLISDSRILFLQREQMAKKKILKTLFRLAICNKLSLHLGKTECMIFGS